MIGIIILNYNTAQDVLECVGSIKANTHMEYRIYVVDNCSTDDSEKILRRNFSEEKCVELIISKENNGYSYGNNLGIKQAIQDGCEYILVSNPDVIYYHNAIDEMYKAIKENPEIGAIGPSCKSLDQDESQLLRKVYTPAIYFFSKKPFRVFRKLFPKLKSEYNYEDAHGDVFLFHGMVRGCCFMIHKDVFSQIGFFDDNVFLYCEEWILAKKLLDIGLMCGFCKKSLVLHKEATSTKKKGTGFQSYHLYLSALYYMKFYSDCGILFLLFCYFQNIGSYILRAVFRKEYRQLVVSFLRANTLILMGQKRKTY